MPAQAFGFGSGTAWGIPLTDAYGASIAVPTPVLLGTLQDISIDFSGDLKELYGQQQAPVALARGKMKITGKAKWAQASMAVVGSLFFGQPITSGIYSEVYDVTGSVIPATPFTITPTVPGTGTWVTDLGVRDTSGNNMTRVASAPTTGQYSVTAGAYLFATADTGKTVFISFQYTATSTVAKSSLINNLPMGYTPTFRCDFFNSLNGQAETMTLYSCVANKFSMSTKIDDFLSQELDFGAFADGAGRIVNLGYAQ
jgi:hypothetical protein